ncbi:MAG: hypothetical protein KFB96_22980 [Thiocapsa sp.]|uniref:hypothetical protein n=1 Tax=Thiocapsa sp. TaxID=2024551 RepID=UPI001BCF2F09|nr:hypothetical protein [Thiocapsa sp.]QVL48433.1 MAG: hypothetical protein KFB96_22980 [Thiocapsa sp.]
MTRVLDPSSPLLIGRFLTTHSEGFHGNSGMTGRPAPLDWLKALPQGETTSQEPARRSDIDAVRGAVFEQTDGLLREP